MQTERVVQSPSGLFAIDWEHAYVHWLAWRQWNHAAFGKEFFPKFQTTLFEWPPEIQAGADAVAAWLSDIRSHPEGKSGRQISSKSVDPHPAPWVRWTPEIMSRLWERERLRRDRDGPYFDRFPRVPYTSQHGDFDHKPVQTRPICWWMRPRDKWEPHWKESEIPFDERDPYSRWMAAVLERQSQNEQRAAE